MVGEAVVPVAGEEEGAEWPAEAEWALLPTPIRLEPVRERSGKAAGFSGSIGRKAKPYQMLVIIRIEVMARKAAKHQRRASWGIEWAIRTPSGAVSIEVGMMAMRPARLT